MNTTSTASAAYTIGDEIDWISQNIFGTEGPKHLEFTRIYDRVLRYNNKTLKAQFLQNVLVTMSRHQLEHSHCYQMLSMAANATSSMPANDAAADNELRHFGSACSEYKILVAVVGFHSDFVSQCYALKQDNNIKRMAEILPVYERHSPSINGYANHLTKLQQTLGFKLNVIWPKDLNNAHAVDVFLKACKVS